MGAIKILLLDLKGHANVAEIILQKEIVGILIININRKHTPFNEVELCSLYCLLNRKEQPVKSQYWMTRTHQMTNRRHSFLFFCLLTREGSAFTATFGTPNLLFVFQNATIESGWARTRERQTCLKYRLGTLLVEIHTIYETHWNADREIYPKATYP